MSGVLVGEVLEGAEVVVKVETIVEPSDVYVDVIVAIPPVIVDTSPVLEGPTDWVLNELSEASDASDNDEILLLQNSECRF